MKRAVIEQRVRDAAARLDLGPLLQRKPSQLSGGQRQRVALGRAIVREPAVFLMDEPLSNLDAKLRVQMRAEISQLQSRLGTTTIYVTHDQVEAMTMGDRVAVMNQGRLQQVDTPQRLYDNPANLFVAGFIGTPPMNLLAATVASQNGTVNVMLGRQQVPLSDEAMRRFPGVRGREGREVVLGVRADNLHRADLRPDLPAINAGLELIEALGSQSIAYFRVDAMVIGVDDDLLEEQELDGEGVTAARPNLVAAMPAEEAVGLRAGEQIPLAIDTKHIHLFDAETGAPLR
jgi:multiple sugar transport system ATP-binding protein